MGPRLQRKQAAAERDAEEGGQAGGHAHERGVAQALPAQPEHAAGHAADRRAAQRQQRRLRAQAAACAGKEVSGTQTSSWGMLGYAKSWTSRGTSHAAGQPLTTSPHSASCAAPGLRHVPVHGPQLCKATGCPS